MKRMKLTLIQKRSIVTKDINKSCELTVFEIIKELFLRPEINMDEFKKKYSIYARKSDSAEETKDKCEDLCTGPRENKQADPTKSLTDTSNTNGSDMTDDMKKEDTEIIKRKLKNPEYSNTTENSELSFINKKERFKEEKQINSSKENLLDKKSLSVLNPLNDQNKSDCQIKQNKVKNKNLSINMNLHEEEKEELEEPESTIEKVNEEADQRGDPKKQNNTSKLDKINNMDEDNPIDSKGNCNIKLSNKCIDENFLSRDENTGEKEHINYKESDTNQANNSINTKENHRDTDDKIFTDDKENRDSIFKDISTVHKICSDSETLNFLTECKKPEDMLDTKITELDLNEIVVVKNISNELSGLYNLGNTCFMNASIQALMGIDEMVRYFIFNRNKFKDGLSYSFSSLVHNLCFEKTAVSPVEFKSKITQITKKYHGYYQHDAPEFINDFIDGLNEEMKKEANLEGKRHIQEHKENKEMIVDGLSINKEEKCKSEEENFLREEIKVKDSVEEEKPTEKKEETSLTEFKKKGPENFISRTFYGAFTSSLKCLSCMKISRRIEPFLTLMVSVPKVPEYHDCVLIFFKEEGRRVKRINIDNSSTVIELKEILKKRYGISQVVIIGMNSKTYYLSNNEKTNKYSKIFCYETVPEKTYILAFINRLEIYILVEKENIKKQVIERVEPMIEKNDYDKDFSINHQEKYSTVETESTNELYFDKETYRITPLPINISYRNKFDLYNQIEAEDPSITLSHCIENFMSGEYISGENSIFCDTCNKKTVFYKKLEISHYPKILIVVIKRYSYGLGMKKIQEKVKFNDIEEMNGIKYELVSVVNHIGMDNAGHYTTYSKRKNKWYLFNDSVVDEIRKYETDRAYVLVFKKI